MNNFKNITILFILLGLFAFSFSVYAAESDDENKDVVEEVEMVLKEKPTGEAYDWLVRLFGNWVNAIYDDGEGNAGKDVTAITIAASYSNVLALLLAVLIITYVTIAGIANSANEGEVLGRSWSSVWLPIRTSLALGLIMPAPVGAGYVSIVQMLIVALASTGINMADNTWDMVTSRIAEGTPFTQIGSLAGQQNSKVMLRQVMCSEAYFDHMRLNGDVGDPAMFFQYTSVNSDGELKRVPNWDESEGKYSRVIANGSDFPRMIQFGPEGECGSVEFLTIPTRWESDLLENDNTDYRILAYKEGIPVAAKLMAEHYDQLVPIARALMDLCKNTPNPECDTEIPEKFRLGGYLNYLALAQEGNFEKITEIGKEFKKAMDQYTPRLIPEVSKAIVGSDGEGSEIVTKFRNSIKDGGWGLAGMWYYELSKFQNLTSEVVSGQKIESKVPDVCHVSVYFFFESTDCIERIQQNISLAEIAYKFALHHGKGSHGQSTRTAEDMMAEVGSSCTVGDCNTDSVDPERISAAASKWVLEAILTMGTDDGDSGEASATDTTGQANPFLVVSGLGHGIIRIAVLMWALNLSMVYLAKANFLEKAAVSVAGGKIGGGVAMASSILEPVLDEVSIFIKSLVVVFGGMGYMLAYGIPFIPVFAWIAVIIGWLLMLVEAFVAAPLAVMQMATPEGEGISGTRMERVLALIAAVAMKPTLSIIGLVASIGISYIGFSVFNQIFWGAANNMMSSGVAAITTGIFDFIAMMFLYTSGAIIVAKLSFSVIYKLPEQILTWFSSQYQMRSFGEAEMSQASEQASQSMDGFSKAHGQTRQAQNANRQMPDGSTGGTMVDKARQEKQ